MNWIVLLVIGGVIGWLASLIMKTDAQMGILGNIIVGIVGSLLGGWLAGAMGIVAGGAMVYVIAVLGAVVLIFLLRAVGVFR